MTSANGRYRLVLVEPVNRETYRMGLNEEYSTSIVVDGSSDDHRQKAFEYLKANQDEDFLADDGIVSGRELLRRNVFAPIPRC
jgi:hypothetical protein